MKSTGFERTCFIKDRSQWNSEKNIETRTGWGGLRAQGEKANTTNEVRKKREKKGKRKTRNGGLRNNYFVNWKKEKRKEEDFRLRFKIF